MEFKTPHSYKRRSNGDDDFSSPRNRKKTKLLSTTIATPEIRQPQADPFDDNFSQFFHTQFIKQVDLETSIIENAKNKPTSSEYNFTQMDGLSQFFNDTQFETSITSAQRCSIVDSTVNKEENMNDMENGIGTENDEQPIEFIPEDDENVQQNENEIENHAEKDEEDDLAIQSSQMFLRELTTLQMNISSIVDETINASKFHSQDFVDPAGQFEVYKSNVTESQYMHLKRPKETIENRSLNMPSTSTGVQQKKIPLAHNTTAINTEMMEDQLLAEMVFTTQVLARNTEILIEDQLLAQFDEFNELDVSEKLNECIDPDSSALALLLDEEEKENNPQNGNNCGNSSENTKENQQIEPKRNQNSENVNHGAVARVRQTETVHHSPVTAANFYSMGPFFGLPLKVKKLIKNFKNIDDLYGKRLV